MNYIKTITNGIIKENPTFVLLLGMCPTLATTTSGINGMSMGLATMFVLTFALALLGAVRELIGAGTLFGIALLPETCNVLLFVLPPGAFITLGYLIAIVNKLRG